MDKQRNEADPPININLVSPAGTPHAFAIEISNALPSAQGPTSFLIKGNDPITGLDKTFAYHLSNKEHISYLDLFEQLAEAFGLQLPYNRQPIAHKKFKAPYREVLSENIAPGMLYGYGDPAILRVQKETGDIVYYLIVTSNDAPDSFPLLRSHNLEDWVSIGYIFPEGNKPAWALDGLMISDYWAPEMHLVTGEYRVYFVAREKHTRELCIGMARSNSPEGPFVPDPAPLLRGNVIDPHIFVGDNDTAYLFWKEDNNEVWPGKLLDLLYSNTHLISQLFTDPKSQVTASFIVTLWPWAKVLDPMERFLVLQIFIESVSTDFTAFIDRLQQLNEKQPVTIKQEIDILFQQMRTRVYAQPLAGNGSWLVGEKKLIIQNDLDWEAHLVEGMWVAEHHQKYYLFYAGNDFSTDKYGIGVAIADSPLGPYKKMPAPLLYSTAQWRAPGHPSLTFTPEGKPELFLHAYFPGNAGYKQFRALLAVPVLLQADKVSLPI